MGGWQGMAMLPGIPFLEYPYAQTPKKSIDLRLETIYFAYGSNYSGLLNAVQNNGELSTRVVAHRSFPVGLFCFTPGRRLR